jgi:hypothetical protein
MGLGKEKASAEPRFFLSLLHLLGSTIDYRCEGMVSFPGVRELHDNFKPRLLSSSETGANLGKIES